MTGEKRKINSEGPEGYTNAGPVPKRVYSTADNPGYGSDKTILDILIEDCWRVLFGYVSVVDIVRSRRVSRRWCDLVDGYLKGVRLCIQSRSSAVLKPDRVVKGRVLDVHPKYYNTVIERYGRSIVATDCLDESSLCLLLKHCLGLEELRVHKPGLKYDLETRALQFYKLRRVCLMYIFHFDDDHIRKFLKCHKLEELKIDHNHVMKGQCLTHLTQNLKTLQLDTCRALRIKPLLHSIKSLTELTKLELNCASESILQNVYKLIEKTPKLEHLGLDWYKITDVGGLVEAICGLKRLKHLSLRFNCSVKDEWLEAIGTSCKELRTVAIGGCKCKYLLGSVRCRAREALEI